MIIKDAAIGLNATAQYTVTNQVIEQIQVKSAEPLSFGQGGEAQTVNSLLDSVQLSPEAIAQMELDARALAEQDSQISNVLDSEPRFTEADALRKDILTEMLTRVLTLGEAAEADLTLERHENPTQIIAMGIQDPQAMESDDDRHLVAVVEAISRDVEHTMTFSATGTIATEDGRRIDISVALSMTDQTDDIAWGKTVILKDPLVINFSGAGPELTDTTFRFDLDNDGQEDQISFLQQGSGFLAYDANGNGVVDNGSELFGTRTGNGFSELSLFDEDGNQWIDENDDIFHKLQIWSLDAAGNRTLTAIGEKGIGAIYLGNVATDLTLRGEDSRIDGALSTSGIGLMEDGRAVTVHQIDLVVDDFLYESGLAGRLPEPPEPKPPTEFLTSRLSTAYQGQDGDGAQKTSISLITIPGQEPLSLKVETAERTTNAMEAGVVRYATTPSDSGNLLEGAYDGQVNLLRKMTTTSIFTSLEINPTEEMIELLQESSQSDTLLHAHKAYEGSTIIDSQGMGTREMSVLISLQNKETTTQSILQASLRTPEALKIYQDSAKLNQLTDLLAPLENISKEVLEEGESATTTQHVEKSTVTDTIRCCINLFA